MSGRAKFCKVITEVREEAEVNKKALRDPSDLGASRAIFAAIGAGVSSKKKQWRKGHRDEQDSGALALRHVREEQLISENASSLCNSTMNT